jgi:hypothetical protein
LSRKLTYRDALRVLERDESLIVQVLDKLSMVGLLATSSVVPAALALLGARDDVVKLGKDAVKKLSTKLRGIERYQRTERLVAAHGIIVVISFFEAINDLDLPFTESSLNLIATEELSLATGAPPESARTPTVIERLVASEIPIPSAQTPFEEARKEVQAFYQDLAARLSSFVSGLSIHDEFNESQRRQSRDLIKDFLPKVAARRYVDSYIRLAVDCPEFFFWANLQDHSATRQALTNFRGENRKNLTELFVLAEDTKIGLMGLRRALQRMEDHSHTFPYPEQISQSYQAIMDRPMVDISDEEAVRSITIPTFRASYINPHFRWSTIQGSVDNAATESWWEHRPIEEDLERFIASYITSVTATDSPLIVLGQPGAGKSVLMKVLAAHLRGPSFLPILVELRRVSANAPLLDQIEEAVRGVLKKRLDWADFVRSAPSALPVVLLDGLDELLQSTGLSRSDYLSQVRLFQRDEEEAGRRVAMLVSSRTVVADQVTIPIGSTVVRLEAFDQPQTKHWLTVWNSINKVYFERNSLQPLQPEVVLAQPDLAAQPLLLLMMALYDSLSNRLQTAGRISEGELYSNLLRMFADREVRRLKQVLSADELETAIDTDLFKLAVVACGMFNRGRQTISDIDLEEDLMALGADVKESKSSGLPEPQRLVAARLVVGRFFFIHEAQATLEGTRRKTYEFLHATFGEFLVAAMIERSLRVLLHMRSLPTTLRHPLLESGDDLLHAVLSFKPISARRRTIDFLQELLPQHFTGREIGILHGLLCNLFSNAASQREADRYSKYFPAPATVTERIAAYSANLLLLILLTAPEAKVSVNEALFGSVQPIAQWQRQVLLWKSQLASEDIASLEAVIHIVRSVVGGERVLHVSLSNHGSEDTDTSPSVPDLDWAVAETGSLKVSETAEWNATVVERWQRDRGLATERKYWRLPDDEYSNMSVESRDDLFRHILYRISMNYPSVAGLVATDGYGNVRSVASELIGLLLGEEEEWEDDLVDRYLFLLSFVQANALENEEADLFVHRISLQLRSDAPRMDAFSVRTVIATCLACDPRDGVRSLILQIIEENFTRFPDVADVLRDVVRVDEYREASSVLQARAWLLSDDLGLDPTAVLGRSREDFLNSLDLNAVHSEDPDLHRRIVRLL